MSVIFNVLEHIQYITEMLFVPRTEPAAAALQENKSWERLLRTNTLKARIWSLFIATMARRQYTDVESGETKHAKRGRPQKKQKNIELNHALCFDKLVYTHEKKKILPVPFSFFREEPCWACHDKFHGRIRRPSQWMVFVT